jgi:hypothetical protein
MSANLAFALFLFAMAAVLGTMTWRMLMADKLNLVLSEASATWPSITGRIVATSVNRNVARWRNTDTYTDQENTTFEPKVDYSYVIGGREYAGTRISFARIHFARESKANAVVAKYLVGTSTVVAYDPEDPQNSVLDRDTKPSRVSFWTAFMGVATVILAMLGVAMLFISI